MTLISCYVFAEDWLSLLLLLLCSVWPFLDFVSLFILLVRGRNFEDPTISIKSFFFLITLLVAVFSILGMQALVYL